MELKIFATAAVLAAMASVAAANSSTPEPASSSASMISTPAPAPKSDWNVEAPYETDVVIGSADAPVTVVEYGSLTCPHCADFQLKKFESFKTEWIDSGKVKFVFRQFPIDQSAMAAAALVHCLPMDEQHAAINGMYGSIKEWAVGDLKSTIPAQIGKVLGRDVTFEKDFKSCVSAEGFQQIVLKPAFDGMQNGIAATPTFFVNGEKLVGFSEAQPRALDDLVVAKIAGKVSGSK